jgi:hypothetical protein
VDGPTGETTGRCSDHRGLDQGRLDDVPIVVDEGRHQRAGRTRVAHVRKNVEIGAVVAVDALLSVIGTYALLRAYDALFKSEPNPATIVWSAHIAMFWRLAVGSYVAGLVIVLAYPMARWNLALTTRVTAALVPIVGAMIALQGALLP